MGPRIGRKTKGGKMRSKMRNSGFRPRVGPPLRTNARIVPERRAPDNAVAYSEEPQEHHPR